MAAIFFRQHFQTNFLEWKLSYFYSNFTEICSQGSNYHYANIGSDDGLAPNRRQAIIWNNAGLVYWRIYVSLDLNELNHCPLGTSVWFQMCNFQMRCNDTFVFPVLLPSCERHGDPTDVKSTLCHQAACHCLNQCYLRSMTPCGVTKPQWVKRGQKNVNPRFYLLLAGSFSPRYNTWLGDIP